MDIKNKFPELIYFIENPKSYELLYYREDTVHNEYALDVEEAKEIIKFIEDLKKENEKLKKQLPEKICKSIYDSDNVVLEQCKEYFVIVERSVENEK